MGEYSAAQIMGAISVAMRAEDMRGVVDLLHLLAVESPRDAQMILDAIKTLPRPTTHPTREDAPDE